MPRIPTTAEFIATAQQQGLTLAAALRQWLPGASWSEVHKLIEARRVTVSSSPCPDEARRLHAGEIVRIARVPLPPPPRPEEARLRYLDPSVIVIEKPAGMLTHRHREDRTWSDRRKLLQPSLEDVLPALIARAEGRRAAAAAAATKLWFVQRLDRDTSGLLVIARTPEAQQPLIRQFESHAVGRAYLALVHGDCPETTIRSRLVCDRGDGRRGSTSDPAQGLPAVTHVRPLERLRGATLVECRLETGRTHQIRIHLSERGYPVIGDPLYGDRLRDESAGGAPRLLLHAAELAFAHPVSGERLTFEMPQPHDFARVRQRLRGTPP